MSKSQTLWRTGQSGPVVDRKGKGKAVDWEEDGAEGKRRGWMKTAEEEAMVSYRSQTAWLTGTEGGPKSCQ